MTRLLDTLAAEPSAFAASGLGLLVALALSAFAALVLPAHERKYLRLPVIFAALAFVCLLGRALLPDGAPGSRALGLIGLFLLLASSGRSGFLLIVHAVLARRFAFNLPKIVQDIIQIAIYVAVALITLRAAGVEPGSLLATSALLTAVVGLSLQDTLGNLFAGLAIQAQRPFEIGDWIQFDENVDHIGRVVEINWRATRIITLDHIEIIVPNGVLAKAPIQNFTKPVLIARRNIYVVAPYRASPARVEKLMLEAIAPVSGVLAEPAPSIVVSDFHERGVEYWIRIFIDDFERRDVIMGDVRERIWYAMSRANLEIPAPQRQIELRERSPETIERERERGAAERERALSRVHFMRVLPPEARRELARLAATRLYGEGESIIVQGAEGDELFIVLEGEVSVIVANERREAEVATLGPGKFFGEMSLMTGEPRRASVRAKTECQVLVVNKPAFQEILAANDALLQEISEVLAKRDDQLDQRAAQELEAGSMLPTEQGQELLGRIRRFFSL